MTLSAIAQNESGAASNNFKGRLYIYWGWNRAMYTKSEIHFTGNNYDFTLHKVIAKDRQSPIEARTYLNPTQATIPQYNFRVGYFIKSNYNISFGIDHMKYVVQQNQTVKISGNIAGTGTQYDGTYDNNNVIIRDGFLKYEHTDGLNYFNFDLRRFDRIFDWNKVQIHFTEGVGVGGLYPRSDVTLINNERNDKFHLAGYGMNVMAGLNIEFFNHFFIQSEFKTGFINLPDVHTTNSEFDKARQHFFFSQVNILFGATFNLRKPKAKSDVK
ncbi:MAG: hypothetical protein IPP29_15660 [Bacteroidetes bacterium]|nr:hypothetical protein [Bacteroidota bacterium]